MSFTQSQPRKNLGTITMLLRTHNHTQSINRLKRTENRVFHHTLCFPIRKICQSSVVTYYQPTASFLLSLLRVLEQGLKPLLNVVSHFWISYQAHFTRLRPPVQLEIAHAILKESKLINAFVLPVTGNAQLSDQSLLQLLQTPLKMHRGSLLLILFLTIAQFNNLQQR